jgi:hypothetical protein
MNFKWGIFKKAIDLGQKAMAKSTPLENLNWVKSGESYFNLKQYDTSIPYLVDYKGKKESGTIQILPIGLCALQTKDYEVPSRNSIKSLAVDFVAQNAYYHWEKVISIPIKTTSFECF